MVTTASQNRAQRWGRPCDWFAVLVKLLSQHQFLCYRCKVSILYFELCHFRFERCSTEVVAQLRMWFRVRVANRFSLRSSREWGWQLSRRGRNARLQLWPDAAAKHNTWLQLFQWWLRLLRQRLRKCFELWISWGRCCMPERKEVQQAPFNPLLTMTMKWRH